MTIKSDELVITNSVIKSFKGCPQATKYKHFELLGPKYNTSKPLKRGTWFHGLLEARYKGESVTKAHKEFVGQFGKLFDEEKEAMGDLPHEMADLYRAYRWHYRDDDSWKIHEVEIKLEAELPNGMQAQGKADLLVEDEYGLWAVDHKTHKSLPRTDYRLVDFQSPYYIWLFRECGIPVRGFIWNYVVPEGPKPLKFNKDGSLSKRQPHTDYPTALKSAQEHEALVDDDVQAILARLETVRYNRDEVQTSDFFRRDLMEKPDDMIQKVVDDISRTADRYADWWDRLLADPEAPVERNPSRQCDWCSYRSLCTAELIGLDAEGVRRREYTEHDPFAYYESNSIDK